MNAAKLKNQSFYDEMHFQYIQTSKTNPAPSAKCLICGKILKNTERERLSEHRNSLCPGRPSDLELSVVLPSTSAVFMSEADTFIKMDSDFDDEEEIVEKHEDILLSHNFQEIVADDSLDDNFENESTPAEEQSKDVDSVTNAKQARTTESSVGNRRIVHETVFRTNAVKKDNYILYDFIPKYIKVNGKMKLVGECKHCKRVMMTCFTPTMRKHYNICQMAENQFLENKSLYDALQFKYVPSRQNNGRTVVQCLLCQKKFLQLNENFMQMHRQVCSDEKSWANLARPFRDVEIIGRGGKIQTVKECIGCDISFASTESNYFKNHSFHCFGTAIDETPVEQVDEPTPYYIKYGFRRVYLPYSNIHKRGYSCTVCKRCYVNIVQQQMANHRASCQPLNNEKKLFLSKLRYDSKFLIEPTGFTSRIAKCCLCELRIVNLSSDSLKMHRLKCKINKSVDVDVDVNQIEIDETNDEEASAVVIQIKEKPNYVLRDIPIYVENGFIIRNSNKLGFPQRFYQCLTCNTLMKNATSDGVAFHRKKCKLTKTVAYQKGYLIPCIDDNTPIASISFNYHVPTNGTSEKLNSEKEVERKAPNTNEEETEDEDAFDDPLAGTNIFSSRGKEHEIDERLSSKTGIVSGQPCFICNQKSEFHHQNLYEIKSKHSETRICNFIEKWLGENLSQRANCFPKSSDEKSCICTDCLNKINEYDLMCVTAERIDKELRETFLITESLTTIEPENEQNDESGNSVVLLEFAEDSECDEIYENLDPVTVQIAQNLACGSSASIDSNFDFNLDHGFDDDESEDGDDVTSSTSGKQTNFMCSSKMLVEHEHAAQNYVPNGNKLAQRQIYNCMVCPREFRNDKEFKAHMLSHKEEVKANAMKFRCQLCGLNLKETTALTEHLALHARAEKYQCVLCYKIMISKKSLERHIRTDHTEEVNHRCDMCGKSFTERKYLLSHMMWLHDSQKKEETSKCPSCDKVFRCQEGLRRHMRLHEQVKKYGCPVCNKFFKSPGDIRDHQLIHDREEQQRRKIFTCTLCRKSFRWNNQLKVHMREKHSTIAPSTPLN